MNLYNSTRSTNEKISAPEAVLRGIAPDGGLYIRDIVPSIPVEEVAEEAPVAAEEAAAVVLIPAAVEDFKKY